MEDNESNLERVRFTGDDVGVMLLESITRGLYHNPLNSIREYVQNEFDAGATEVRITVSDDRLSIVGDGSGMSLEDLLSARKIGFSSKDPRESVGFRGIGIWSGVAICDEVLISTKKESEALGYVLRVDAKGLRGDIEQGTLPLIEALSRRVRVGESGRDELRSKHGTNVELRNLSHENLPYLTRGGLLSYAEQVLPVRIDPEYKHAAELEKQLKEAVKDYKSIKVLVNEKEAFRPPKAGIHTTKPTLQVITNELGETTAVAWYAISTEGAIRAESRYIVYKKKGFTVGDTTRSNLLILKTTDRHAFSWATGEVHVLDDNVVPTAERIDFETNPFFRSLEESAKALLDEVVRAVRKFQAGETAKERLAFLRTIKKRFLAETDPDERLNIFLEGQDYLRYLNQDVRNVRLEPTLREKAKEARDRLKHELGEMAGLFEAPAGTVPEEAKERKRRRAAPRVQAPSPEQLAGELGAYFPFDRLTLRLLRAVLAALTRLVRGNQAKIQSFVTFLKEELRSSK